MSVIILVFIIIFLYIFTKEPFTCECEANNTCEACEACEANNTCEANNMARTQYNTATHVFGMGWKF